MPEHHCLRPEFTEQLVTRLLAGESINLIAAHGQGRRRTLQDLRSLLPDSISVQQLDLRRDRVDPITWLSQVVEKEKQTLLILHNFNELKLSRGNSCSQPLLDRLNSIKHLPNISLLCLSESESDSPIQYEPLELPPLNSTQIKEELARRGLHVAQAKLMQLAERVSTQPAPYTALKEAVQILKKRNKLEP